MLRIASLLLWTAVFLLIVLALDQFLVRVPASLPAHVAAADFYRDLRSRLFDLAEGTKSLPAPAQPAAPPKGKAAPPPSPASVEAIIEQQRTAPAAPAAKPRYVYADDGGAIHFAETLAEIPEQYRSKANALRE